MDWLQDLAGLTLLTMAGVLLHEAAHHLFGLPGSFSLSRNWPAVPITEANRRVAIRGTLAGPMTNLVLGCVGAALYWSLPADSLAAAPLLYGAVANLSIVLFTAVVNLMADLRAGYLENDLQAVSRDLGLPVLLLPALFSGASAFLLWPLWASPLLPGREWAILLSLAACLMGGGSLICLDSTWRIRLRLRRTPLQ